MDRFIVIVPQVDWKRDLLACHHSPSSEELGMLTLRVDCELGAA